MGCVLLCFLSSRGKAAKRLLLLKSNEEIVDIRPKHGDGLGDGERRDGVVD